MTDERRQFIADLANDEWIDRLERPISDERFEVLCQEWDQRTEYFLSTVDDPLELHLFADLWNWDGDDLETLQRVISCPICERATALLLFWRAQPEDFNGYDPDEAKSDHNRRLFRFISEIQARYVAGDFKEGRAIYDPNADYRLEGPKLDDNSSGWHISPTMYEAV